MDGKGKGTVGSTCPFSRIMARKWNRIIRGMLSMHGLPRQLQIQEVFSGRILRKMGRFLRETRHKILRNWSSTSPGLKLVGNFTKGKWTPGILAFHIFWIFWMAGSGIKFLEIRIVKRISWSVGSIAHVQEIGFISGPNVDNGVGVGGSLFFSSSFFWVLGNHIPDVTHIVRSFRMSRLSPWTSIFVQAGCNVDKTVNTDIYFQFCWSFQI